MMMMMLLLLPFGFQLKTVEALLGSTAKLGEVIVLGMITQLKEVGLAMWHGRGLFSRAWSILTGVGYAHWHDIRSIQEHVVIKPHSVAG